jgi:hypothetical protein
VQHVRESLGDSSLRFSGGYADTAQFFGEPGRKTGKPDRVIDNSFVAELDKSRASSKNYKTLMMEHWNGGVLG